MRRAPVAVLALTVPLALASCSDTGGDGATHVVGAPIVQSGPGAFAGEPVAQGIELAVQEINDSGFLGNGATMEVEVVDTAGDPAQAIAAFRQFEADGVAGVLCCTLGGEAGALKPLLEQSPVPGVVTVSILDGLADPPHLFRPFEVPGEPGGMYDEFLDSVLGDGGGLSDVSSAVVVVNNDNDAMVQDSVVYTEGLERNGVDVVSTVQVAVAETAFTGVSTQVLDSDPDLVVASTIGSTTAGLARALRQRGFDGPILSNVGADSRAAYDISEGAMAGTVFPSAYHAEFANSEIADDFADDFADAYGSAPDMFAAQGYTAAWVMATGIRDAGSGDPASVGEALSDLTTTDSVFGTIEWEGGQAQVVEPARALVWGDGGSVDEFSG